MNFLNLSLARLVTPTQHRPVAVGPQVDQAGFNFGQLLRVYILSPVVNDDIEGFEGNGHNIEIFTVAVF